MIEFKYELKCPYCGSFEIELLDCLDEDASYEEIIRKYHGFCKNCNADLFWDGVYKLTDVCNMTEDN